MKDDFPGKLAIALLKVIQGGNFISEELSTHVFNGLIGGKQRSGIASLSNRELDVLRQIGQGLGTRQIAEDFGLSVKTIEAHRAHLKEKLNIQTAARLVWFATLWMDQGEPGDLF